MNADNGLTVEREGETNKVEEVHEHFSSRWAFWLSAIGCSVGFGNVWRFPYLCYSYGGAAFFVPYLTCLILIVLPIAVTEFGIGQISQGSHVKAFAILGRQYAGMGLCSLVSFCFSNFYTLLLGWTLIYMINSVKYPIPWELTDHERGLCKSFLDAAACKIDLACEWSAQGTCEASELAKIDNFYREALSIKNDWNAGVEIFNVWLSLAQIASWIFVIFFVVGGAKIMGYVNSFIVVTPSFMMLSLVIVGLTLDGAFQGVKKYIGEFDFSRFNHNVLSDSLGQAIFSIGPVQGTMVAYASHNQRGQNFVQDACVVGFGDLFFAFIAGIAVFSVIGFLSKSLGMPIDKLPISSKGLAYKTYPIGVTKGLAAPWSQILSAMFFLTLWLLGLSTMVSFMEAICLQVVQSRVWKKWKVQRYLPYVIIPIVGMLFSLIYSVDLGSQLLDMTDNFLSIFVMSFLLAVESMILGWRVNNNLVIEKVGDKSYHIHFFTVYGGLTLSALLMSFTSTRPTVCLAIAFGIAILGLTLAMLVAKNDEEFKVHYMDQLYYLTGYSVDTLRQKLNDEGCRDSVWRLPRLWSYLMKYAVATVSYEIWLLSLLDPRKTIFYPFHPVYGSYPAWIIFVGTFAGVMTMAAVTIALLFPNLITPLLPPEEELFYLFEKSTEYCGIECTSTINIEESGRAVPGISNELVEGCRKKDNDCERQTDSRYSNAVVNEAA